VIKTELNEFKQRFDSKPSTYNRIIRTTDGSHIYANAYAIAEPFSPFDSTLKEIEIYFYINIYFEDELGNKKKIRINTGDVYLKSIEVVW